MGHCCFIGYRDHIHWELPYCRRYNRYSIVFCERLKSPTAIWNVNRAIASSREYRCILSIFPLLLHFCSSSSFSSFSSFPPPCPLLTSHLLPSLSWSLFFLCWLVYYLKYMLLWTAGDIYFMDQSYPQSISTPWIIRGFLFEVIRYCVKNGSLYCWFSGWGTEWW